MFSLHKRQRKRLNHVEKKDHYSQRDGIGYTVYWYVATKMTNFCGKKSVLSVKWTSSVVMTKQRRENTTS